MPRYESESDSDNEDRRERRRRRGEPDRLRTSRAHISTWWIDGKGIARQVLQGNIQRMLGPDAVSFPAQSKDGTPGYNIKAPVIFTSSQLEDLKHLSRQYGIDDKPRRTDRTDRSFTENSYPSEYYPKMTQRNDPGGPFENPGPYDRRGGNLDYRNQSSLDYQGSAPFPLQSFQNQGLPPLSSFSTPTQYPSSLPNVDYTFGPNATSRYQTSYAPLGPVSPGGDPNQPYYPTQDSYPYQSAQGQSNQVQYPRQDRASPVHEPPMRSSGSRSANLYDCPERGCERVGERALKGKDNLAEHLRQVHGKAVRTK